jgi:hypothetical protein
MLKRSGWLTGLILGVTGAMIGALVLEHGWALSWAGHRLLEMGIVMVGFGLIYWCTQAGYLAALREPKATSSQRATAPGGEAADHSRQWPVIDQN